MNASTEEMVKAQTLSLLVPYDPCSLRFTTLTTCQRLPEYSIPVNFLVIGGGGMLGTDVVAELKARGHTVFSPSAKELDITNPESVALIATGAFGPDVRWCINCAAYTAVDLAESESDQAMAVNAVAPGYLANVCLIAGIRLIHISTDFVFDGEKSEPYLETDKANPLGVYGQSKLLGEQSVMAANGSSVVVRTSWLYGPNGKSFPRTMINAYLAGKQLRVVADQTGCPTYTGDLARALADMAEKEAMPGIYHATGVDAMTWHGFAKLAIKAYCQEVLKETREVEIEPIPTEAYPTPARRPKYSVLSNAKLHEQGIAPMRAVDECLREFVRRLEA